MNGAELLLRTVAPSGWTYVSTDPGTAEMYFIAALDAVGGIRTVLRLFEGDSLSL